MIKVDFYTGELTDELRKVAESYEYKPYHYVTAATEANLNDIFLNRLKKFLKFCNEQPKQAAFLVAKDPDGKILGISGVQLLEFDTAVLKIPSGKITFLIAGSSAPDKYDETKPVADALVDSAMEWLKEKGIIFTNIRTTAWELPTIHACESRGFYFVDNGITALWHKDNFDRYVKGPYDIRLFADKDLPKVLEIMSGAYEQDRFHMDPNIPHEAAEDLYQLWIQSSCTQPKDQEWVLIAERKGEIKGFFQYEYNHEFSSVTGIELYTYGPAAVIRDRTSLGAYYSLLSFAVTDSVMRGADYAMTRIPFGIQPIIKLTLRLGPSFLTNDLTFHHFLK